MLIFSSDHVIWTFSFSYFFFRALSQFSNYLIILTRILREVSDNGRLEGRNDRYLITRWIESFFREKKKWEDISCSSHFHLQSDSVTGKICWIWSHIISPFLLIILFLSLSWHWYENLSIFHYVNQILSFVYITKKSH